MNELLRGLEVGAGVDCVRMTVRFLEPADQNLSKTPISSPGAGPGN